MVLFILLIGIMWYNDAQIKNRLYEKLLKDFVSKLVPCKIEKREKQFFIYNGVTEGFIAQGRTPQEVENNMPKDGKIYVDWACRTDIMDVIEEEYVKDKTLVH